MQAQAEPQRKAPASCSSEMPIGEWLASISSSSSSSSLQAYADALCEYGYDDTNVLFELEEADLQEALEDLEVKPAHRKLILRAFGKAATQ